MRYIVVDLEATCWENVRTTWQMEIIEIGAVELPSASEPPSSEFCRFIQPVVHRTLSEFCTKLTTIRQEDVDRAERFPPVFAEFLEWIGPDPFVLCSWGNYDVNAFRTDCRRHGVPFPDSFERHINIKTQFSKLMAVKSCGMTSAFEVIGATPEGTHHRGIDDARNIARLASLLLPTLEATGDIPPERT